MAEQGFPCVSQRPWVGGWGRSSDSQFVFLSSRRHDDVVEYLQFTSDPGTGQ